MSKTKIIKPSVDAVAMMTQREQIPVTGAYETVKSTPSNIDDPSVHVM